jgi:hypothetical protein
MSTAWWEPDAREHLLRVKLMRIGVERANWDEAKIRQ